MRLKLAIDFLSLAVRISADSKDADESGSVDFTSGDPPETSDSDESDEFDVESSDEDPIPEVLSRMQSDIKFIEKFYSVPSDHFNDLIDESGKSSKIKPMMDEFHRMIDSAFTSISEAVRNAKIVVAEIESSTNGRVFEDDSE